MFRWYVEAKLETGACRPTQIGKHFHMVVQRTAVGVEGDTAARPNACIVSAMAYHWTSQKGTAKGNRVRRCEAREATSRPPATQVRVRMQWGLLRPELECFLIGDAVHNNRV